MISSFLVVVGVEYASVKGALTISYVLDRTGMIILGVVISFLTSYLFFPLKGSALVHRGLQSTFSADIGQVISGVLELYSNDKYAKSNEKGIVSDQKKALYSHVAAVFSKTTEMTNLVGTTSGEIVSLKICPFKVEMFPSQKYTTILFCANQLMYITLTIFYGLRGEAKNTSYSHLFSRHIDGIRSHIERFFIEIAKEMDDQNYYSNVAGHIKVIQAILEGMEQQHKENLNNGVIFKHKFDDIQAFSHLWSCLKLFLRKASHLAHSVDLLHQK